MPFVWLSFLDPHKPSGQRFLGVAIVEVPASETPEEMAEAAIQKAWSLGINPGGEVIASGVEPPPEAEALRAFYGLTNRLLSEADVVSQAAVPIERCGGVH